MDEACEPIGIAADAVTFRYERRDDDADLLLVDIDRPGVTRQCLTVKREQAVVLAEHTVTAENERGPLVVDREKVEFSVAFEYAPPIDRRHDRAAIFEYGEGKLHVTGPDGDGFRVWVCPKLAQRLHHLSK